MDIVSKYYKICEVMGDDLEKVAFCIKMVGATQRPSFVFKDIEYLWLDKYGQQIDELYEMSNDSRRDILVRFASFAKYVGAKYDFDPMREIKMESAIKQKKHDSENIKPDDEGIYLVNGIKTRTTSLL